MLNHNEPGPKGPMPHGKGLRKIAWLPFLFEIASKINIYIVTFSLCMCMYMWKMEQMENRNGKLQCVCCNQKRKTEVCFPWLANDKQ